MSEARGKKAEGTLARLFSSSQETRVFSLPRAISASLLCPKSIPRERNYLMSQPRQIIGAVLFATPLSVTSCAAPPPSTVAWENNQSAVGPTSPGPQGILVVYSETYEGEHDELPTIY